MTSERAKKIPYHPAAAIFDVMEESELCVLAEDIKANGLIENIWLHPDGSILDGRNRHLACLKAGVEPRFTIWKGKGSPIDFVLSMNLRRHPGESARAMAAARIATLEDGQRADRVAAPIGAASQPEAARKLNVGRRSVQRARDVLSNGIIELIRAVDHELIAVYLAAKFSHLPADQQKAIVEKVRQNHVGALEAFRLVRADLIKKDNLEKPTGKYRVIYADPPWSYGNTQPDYQTEQRDHYPVMSMKELLDWKDIVSGIAEDDCVLFLWATSPILPEALLLVDHWGFTYKASFVWDKIDHNMGHYNSVRHELLLICTRGSCQPDRRKLHDSVVTEKRTAHTRKPAIFYDIIEDIYDGPYIELFVRGPARQGWKGHGYES